jgi:hypothetical protein
LSSAGFQVIGVYGNTKADEAAKDALIFDIAEFQITYEIFY